ncbi:hypothetical protein ALQ30_200753 [Pseudomonas syringae pv. persicae]|uniref:Uncharacterized protein n=1 Tax=Pseudomonas syringae pv. persicae TaxID=237306 RepID=A0A3M4ASX9_9PSED|nr:hypothetical protein [Pseudomonas syringae pv. actinidiae]RMP09425.1 hypothetical protein ALQ30_200753 [Pseudomonas syringae pv. persicae]
MSQQQLFLAVMGALILAYFAAFFWVPVHQKSGLKYIGGVLFVVCASVSVFWIQG